MCERKHMQLETKFLRLPEPAALGDHLDGWRVCWLGGWDSSHLFYWVMVVTSNPAVDPQQPAVAFSVPNRDDRSHFGSRSSVGVKASAAGSGRT